MKRTHFEIGFFEFFIELSSNNQKNWFDDNKKRYETEVKMPFLQFVERLIELMIQENSDYAGLTAKECVFRIYKDTRFSKDKTPYKTFCSASLHIGGRKTMWPGGIYFELGAESCSVYSGVYLPEKEDLYKLRSNLAAHPQRLNQVISEPTFIKTFGKVLGEKNKILPPEFKSAAIEQPLIYNKQFYVQHEFEPEIALEPDFDLYIIDKWKKAQPFNNALLGI